jgi:hypothetical protein
MEQLFRAGPIPEPLQFLDLQQAGRLTADPGLLAVLLLSISGQSISVMAMAT